MTYDEFKIPLEQVLAELDHSMQKFGPFHSTHEGYAVLLEEMDELWDEVKQNGSIDCAKKQFKLPPWLYDFCMIVVIVVK